MAPLIKTVQISTKELQDTDVITKCAPRIYNIVYLRVLQYTVLHIFAAYGLYLGITAAKWKTIISFCIFLIASVVGITVAAHRLWSHKAFKATMPLQIVLMLFNSIAFQSTAIDWIRDHRLHHKHSDTDADPYNASRGFFFSHIGWLLVRKHPLVLKKGKTVDMSDIYNNPVLKFQQKHAVIVIGLCCYVVPTIIPIYFWNETFSNAFYINTLRHVIGLHLAFSVNSFAHLWGTKPYDKSILPVQSLFVSLISGGEGFHNYHHVFPCDYRTAEIGNNWLNPSTLFIDVLAKFGLVYDLKSTPENVINNRIIRTGDGSNVWGIS
ncbi:PREDICTED: acyl-CoA Delta(11) desaturase-like [Papilio xuthus]|uniref:Acyl-CoA Delta(11) desaturase-like n=1 Tax=Papilio xuthus TaxID=66420 RepID=A0AAJ7E6B0_PAPXU|nr:PREDICTED: acyl-CoA Delta(11) desaturase-like [Papilio xuthus]